MADKPLIEAFNTCVDRMAKGDSLEACLAAYPTFADDLAVLLLLGERVHQVQANPQEEQAARQRVQMRVQSELHHRGQNKMKLKRKRSTSPVRWIAAVFAALVAGIGIGGVGISLFRTIPIADNPATLPPSSGLVFQDCDVMLAQSPLSPTTIPTIDAFGMMATATVIVQQATLQAGGFFPQATVVGNQADAFALTATALVNQATAMAQGTQFAPLGTYTATPTGTSTATPTPFALGTYTPTPPPTQTYAAFPTPLPSQAAFVMTPSPVLNLPQTGGGGGGNNETGIVTTSVAQMLPMTASPYPYNAGSVAATVTASAFGTPYPSPNANLTNRLNAGQIDDNGDWDIYTLYRTNFLSQYAYAVDGGQVDDVDVLGRHLIRVVNQGGQPIIGAGVQVYYGNSLLVARGCTYADGLFMFLPNVSEGAQRRDVFRVVASKAGLSVVQEIDLRDRENLTTLTLFESERPQTELDVVFLIDSTGSMEDEIAAIANNILYISQEIDALGVDTRYAWVSYKDPNYQTIVQPFVNQVGSFQATINTLTTAGGSGETLNDGLDKTLNALSWRGADTLKLVFLIGDEPPYMGPEFPTYAQSARLAAERGIKVHTIASSGLDPVGEYVFRQIAQLTFGRFIFLTYEGGQAGIAGAERPDLNVGEAQDPETGVGEYTVQELHNIILSLIREEIQHQTDE